MPDDLPDLVRDNSREMEQKVEMVLNEIIESEKKYVKTLNTIVEKLVKPAAKRTELFSPTDITTLFGNIVELNQMHKAFYQDLSLCSSGDVRSLMLVIETHMPQMSIGYSKYCSNFPHATAFYNKLVKTSQPRQPRIRRGIGSINSINFTWDHDDDGGGYRRLKEDRGSTSSSPYATISRRHSIYSGDSSSDDSINESPKRFSQYFSKKRSNSQKEKSESCIFFPRAFSRLTFLTLSLASSDLDDGLPVLAYLLEPVQRVMRYPLLLKNLKFVLARCPMRHDVLNCADQALETTEQLAILTNLTQPFLPVEAQETHQSKGQASSDKKPSRRRFEFMRQAAQRLRLRAR